MVWHICITSRHMHPLEKPFKKYIVITSQTFFGFLFLCSLTVFWQKNFNMRWTLWQNLKCINTGLWSIRLYANSRALVFIYFLNKTENSHIEQLHLAYPRFLEGTIICSVLMSWLLLIPQTSGIMQYSSFYDWLILLDIKSSKIIHVVVTSMISFSKAT